MEAKQRRLILVLVMAGTLGITAAADAQITSWWAFDETGGSIAYDYYGNWDGRFDMTSHSNYNGDPPTWENDGVRGRVIKLNGDGVVNFGNDPIFSLSSGVFSVGLWVRIPAFTASWEYILSRDSPSASNDWRLGRNSTSTTTLRWTGGSGSVALYTSGVDMDDGNWHHLLWTYDGAWFRLYTDGYLDASDDGNNPRSRNVDMVLGGRGSSAQCIFYCDDLFAAPGVLCSDEHAMWLWQGIKPNQLNFPPKVEAGPGYRVVVEPTSGPVTLELAGIVEDTTVFVPNVLSYQWRQLRGQAGVTFVPDPNVLDVTVTFPEVGRYVLMLRADDGVNEANDTIVVDVKPWYYDGLVTHYKFENNLLDTAIPVGSGGGSYIQDNLKNAGTYRTIYGPGCAPSLGQATYIGKNGDLEEYNYLETILGDSSDLDMVNLGEIAGQVYGAFFTIECYVKPDIPEISTQYSAFLISKWNDDSAEPEDQRAWNFFIYNGELSFEIADITDTDPPPGISSYYGSDTTLAGDMFPRSDEWQHVAVVGNADGTYDLWIDGVLRKSVELFPRNRGQIPDTTAPLRIGDALYNPGESYRGWIDDVKIWRFNQQEGYMKERAQVLAVQGPAPKYKHQYVAGDVLLNWSEAKGYDNPTYSVYMGTDPGNMELAAAHITDNFYDPCGPGNDPDLLADTTYYWKVNIDGGTEGDLWSFKTVLNTDGFLAGHWKFDEPAGTVFHDSAGCDDVGYYQYPAVGDNLPPIRPLGAWIPWPPEGPDGSRAIRFRTYEYVQVEACDPNVYSYMPLDSYSLSCWIRTMPEFRNVWAYFLSKGANSFRLGRFYETNYLRFYCQGVINYGPAVSSNSLVGTVPVGDGYWHHVAAVYEAPTRFSAGGVCLYIDGELDVSGPVTGNHGLNFEDDVCIGGNPAWPTREFTGAMDDVRIYHHHALTAEEIYDLANPYQVINSAPTVNVGDNVIVPYPDPPGAYTTTLTPTVNDDSNPLIMSPRIAWTKLSGPGEVIIDPCIIDWGDWGDFIPSVDCPLPTNITFSAPGYYQLRLKADDIWYTNEDTLWVWVQGAAGMDRTVGYWRFEEDVLETDYPKSADGDDPNTLVIANEVPGGPPLIAEREDPREAPGLHDTVAVSPIPLTGAANNRRLGAGIGRLDFYGERVGTSGYDIEMTADSWGGLVFCEEAITVECWVNLNEQEGTILDLEYGNQGLRIFNTSIGVVDNWSGVGEWDNVSVPANRLMVEFWVETEIPNEHAYQCLITDIMVFQEGWRHIAFTYDKESGVAGVFENGRPAWLTHWFDSTRKSPTGTAPKGFEKFLPIVKYYDGQDGRALALAENLDLLVAAGVDEEPGGLDELRITAEALYPPKFLNVGPVLCMQELKGDMDGDCDVDLVDMKLFWDTWLACNNADPNACFKK